MANDIIFQEYNFRLLDLNHIIEDVEGNIIDELYQFNLLDSKKLTPDIKRIIMNKITIAVCNRLMSYTQRDKVVLYYSNIAPGRLGEYFDTIDIFIEKFIVKLKNILPIRVFVYNRPFSDIRSLRKSNNGEYREFILKLRQYIDTLDYASYTFNKVKLFTKKQGLTFLNQDFFNTLKTRQLLIV